MQTQSMKPLVVLLFGATVIALAGAGCSTMNGSSGSALAQYEANRLAVQKRLARTDSDVRNVSYEQSGSIRDAGKETVRGETTKKAARKVTGEVDPEHIKSITLRDLAPERWFNAYRKATGRGPDAKAALAILKKGEVIYDRALEERKAGKKKHKDSFLAAAKQFDEAILRWPNSGIEEDALFKSAECYFFADHYVDAREKYDTLLKKYSNTSHLDTVSQRRFSLANYWLNLQEKDNPYNPVPNMTDEQRPWADTYGHAIKVLTQIPHDDPGGELSDDAIMLAANAHFKTENYHGADAMYDNLRELYPKSEFQFKAHLLGIKCKEKLYDGADYNSTPLAEAETLIKQARRRFARESREYDNELSLAWKRIRHKRAMVRWELGQYYERRGEYGGARHHYEVLLEEFAETDFGGLARNRMQDIAKKPHAPPNRFEWLTEWFDEEEKRPEPLILNGSLNPYYHLWK